MKTLKKAIENPSLEKWPLGIKTHVQYRRFPDPFAANPWPYELIHTKMQMTNKVQYISILMGSKALKPHWISYEGSCSIGGLRHIQKQMGGIS